MQTIHVDVVTAKYSMSMCSCVCFKALVLCLLLLFFSFSFFTFSKLFIGSVLVSLVQDFINQN